MAAAPQNSPDRAARLKRLDLAPAPVITPSLLNCDFGRMTDELAALKAAGTVAVHLDVLIAREVHGGLEHRQQFCGPFDEPFDIAFVGAMPVDCVRVIT